MGGGTEGKTFVLKWPIGTVIREQRPKFNWTELHEGADSYVVMVRDLVKDEIVAFTDHPVKNTTWTPDRPLDRGRLYGWLVIATKDGKEVAHAPAAGMGRFKILDETGERLLEQAEIYAPGSRLVRGILLYRLGLVAEAQQDLAQLERANPDSKIVKALHNRVGLVNKK